MMEPITNIVTAIMLSLRRRALERQIDRPFDAAVSRELDRVIVEQEALTGQQASTTVRGEGVR